MYKSHLSLLVICWLVAVAGPAAAMRELSHDEIRAAVASGQALSLGTVFDRVSSRVDGQPIEVRVFSEGGLFYQVLIAKPDGRLVSVIVDGRTGRLLPASSAAARSVQRAAAASAGAGTASRPAASKGLGLGLGRSGNPAAAGTVGNKGGNSGTAGGGGSAGNSGNAGGNSSGGNAGGGNSGGSSGGGNSGGNSGGGNSGGGNSGGGNSGGGNSGGNSGGGGNSGKK